MGKALEEQIASAAPPCACPHRNYYEADRTDRDGDKLDGGRRHRWILQEPWRHQLIGGDQERGLPAAHRAHQSQPSLLRGALLHVVQHLPQRLLVPLFGIRNLILPFNQQQGEGEGEETRKARFGILRAWIQKPLSACAPFVKSIYTTFGCRRDALVEMLDALLTSPVIEHPVHLSLAPGFQRTWGSIYDALNAGTMPLPRLEQVVATHPLETPTAWYAVDASVWPRNDADTSPERGYSYHHTRHSHDESIIAGWNSSWLVQLPERCSSWTAPLRVRRMRPGENINQVAAEQIRSRLSPTRSREALSNVHL